jgi:transcriptional regulator with XRE-family HTH domain
MTTAERLRSARKSRGLSQETLARQIAMSVKTIVRIERGDYTTSIGTLRTLADALGVSPAWLLTGEGRGPEPTAEVA